MLLDMPYLSANSKQGTGLVILKGGQKLRIRLKHLYDIGSIIETYHRKVYFPSTLGIPDNATIVDVGASIGDFSVCCASSFHGAKVFSYEPDKDAFELLKENISLNHLEGQIKPYP
ncbi:MAG: FkbM family methyltransferase [Nitrospirae bacterium]|nr:FkbM family methyltransferase [Nitrospirota bacterium]